MRGNSHVRFGGRERADRLAQARYGGLLSTLPFEAADHLAHGDHLRRAVLAVGQAVPAEF